MFGFVLFDYSTYQRVQRCQLLVGEFVSLQPAIITPAEEIGDRCLSFGGVGFLSLYLHIFKLRVSIVTHGCICLIGLCDSYQVGDLEAAPLTTLGVVVGLHRRIGPAVGCFAFGEQVGAQRTVGLSNITRDFLIVELHNAGAHLCPQFEMLPRRA